MIWFILYVLIGLITAIWIRRDAGNWLEALYVGTIWPISLPYFGLFFLLLGGK